MDVPTDFFWSYTDEPHATRRKEIMSKYPQVKELFGHCWKTKYIVFAWVSSQILLAYLLRDAAWLTITVIAYCFGGFATHALFLAMHEISHNLAFAKTVPNKLLGCFANTATTFPHFSMFQRYHMEHHQFQGVDGIDVDIPSRWEGMLFTNWFTKLLWVQSQALFYVIRPLLLKPKQPGFWEFINWSLCLLVDYTVFQAWGSRAFGYLFLSALLGSGLHPIAGHFIAEHFVFVPGQETYSYYGPLNILTFNVGYHNEHHDFPRIPGSRLPALKTMAAEYYDTLPYHTSWIKVMWDYIMSPNITPFCRVVRKNKKSAKAE